MSEQARKKIAVLERALLIAARMLLDMSAFSGSFSTEEIIERLVKKARWELRMESENRMAEAIKKHPRA